MIAPRQKQQPHDNTGAHVNFIVTYDILLSPSYRVPVLHFTVQDADGLPVTDQSTIFTEVVPLDFRAQVESVGVIGGLSMTVIPTCKLNTLFCQVC